MGNGLVQEWCRSKHDTWEICESAKDKRRQTVSSKLKGGVNAACVRSSMDNECKMTGLLVNNQLVPINASFSNFILRVVTESGVR